MPFKKTPKTILKNYLKLCYMETEVLSLVGKFEV